MKWLRNACLLWLALVGPARASETLSQLITDARVLAMDAASSNRQRFSDSNITEFINVGQREAMAQTGAIKCLMQSSSFMLARGTTYYALPSNFLSFSRVTIGQLYMTEMSPAALDGRSRGWESASGHPTYYFMNFSSRGLVGFAPWPSTATDTDTIKMEYYVQPNDLVNSGDLPFNGVNELQDFHHALAYYAAAIMATIDGLSPQATAYMSFYASMVGAMKYRCVDRSNYLPSAAASP